MRSGIDFNDGKVAQMTFNSVRNMVDKNHSPSASAISVAQTRFIFTDKVIWDVAHQLPFCN